jgi:hypothetical protein
MLQQAQVYAIVNGQTVPMAENETQGDDESLGDTSYSRFSGTFTLPDSTTTVQKPWIHCCLRRVGWLQEEQDRRRGHCQRPGAALRRQTCRHLVRLGHRVSEQHAVGLFQPTYLSLPKGALDYAVGDELRYNAHSKTFSFYRLQSDLRVYSSDISVVSAERAPVDNRITTCTVKRATKTHTMVILNTQQKGDVYGQIQRIGYHRDV